MIRRYRANHRHLCHRCSVNSWMYNEEQSQDKSLNEEIVPTNFLCRGFSGVMMIMGTLCFVVEKGSSMQTCSVVVGREKFQNLSSKANLNSKLAIPSPLKWMISTQFIR